MARARLEATLTDVDTDFKVATINNEPASYQILRARATIVSGTGTSVALRVAEVRPEALADDDIVLEYELTVGKIDSVESTEEIVFFAKERNSSNVSLGNTYVGVKCDTAGNTVNVKLDVEIEA